MVLVGVVEWLVVFVFFCLIGGDFCDDGCVDVICCVDCGCGCKY